MTNHELDPIGPDALEPFSSLRVGHGPGTDFSVHGIINTLMRRRWWIIGSTLLGGACAILVIVMMKPVYEATATIELNKASSGSLDLAMGDSSASALGLGRDLQTDLHTESKVLKSDSVEILAIKTLNLNAQSPFSDSKHPYVRIDNLDSMSPAERTRLLKIFDSHLAVNTVEGTKLIEVTYRSQDPKQASDVANALISSYRELYLQNHYAAVSQASDWMTKQLGDLKANVENSEKRLTDYEKASGILTVPTLSGLPSGGTREGGQIHSPVIQRLDELNSALTAAETDRVQKEAIFRFVATGNPDVILGLKTSPIAQGSSILAVGGQELQGLQGLESKRSDLLVALAQARSIYGPNNRHLKDLQTQLDAINSQLQVEMRKISDRAAADLKISRQTEDDIRARFNAAQVEAVRLNEKNVQLAVLSQEASSQKQLYEDLYTKLQEADLSAGVKASNITVVDPAFPQSVPILPRPIRFLALGILFGAFFGIAAAYLAELVDTKVVGLTEIEEITGSAVIAVIPDFKTRSSNKKTREEKLAPTNELTAPQAKAAWVLAHPTSPSSEAIRALRTGVFLSRPGGIPKTLLVTSSVPGEGKSTVTFNLAAAMAQDGKRVVILEADMRRPTLKRYLGEASDIGLSSVLTDLVSLDEAIIQKVGMANLDVLPAGPIPPLPAELLGSAKFDSVLRELRSRYDIVLIDSPPALMLTDAIAIALKVDAVVWIVRAGKATRPQLLRSAQQIRRSRIPFIGYVLNGLDSRIDPYGYGYSYYGYTSKMYGAYYGEDS